jgi:hypothetical protein
VGRAAPKEWARQRQKVIYNEAKQECSEEEKRWPRYDARGSSLVHLLLDPVHIRASCRT